MKTTIKLLSSTFLLVTLASTARAEFFPLQTGNVWAYKQSSGRIPQAVRTIEVGKPATFGGQDYFNVNFFGRQVWLREADGKLLAYDVTSKTEQLWIDFTATDGKAFATSIEQCSKSASIDPKATHYRGPFGEFDTVVTVKFDASNCADAGYQYEVYLPYIGLVQHSEQTIAGPIVFDLVYSRTGLTEVADSQVSFGLALDSNTYPAPQAANKQAIARMTLRNNTPQVLKLVFPSGQDFDVAIRNAKDEVVYRWSADKVFTQAVRNVEIAPGESKTFVVIVPLDTLPAGRYTAEANLATINPKEYVASVTFDITDNK